MRRIAIGSLLVTLSVLSSAARSADAYPAAGDPALCLPPGLELPAADRLPKQGLDERGEQIVALAMLDPREATNVAVRSGDWSEPATWSNGVPKKDDRVYIPRGVKVVVDGKVSPIRWLTIDGEVSFKADVDTRLDVETILVAHSGRLEVGATQSPIRSDVTATIVFQPRSGEYAHDPFEVAGGLISMGRVVMQGAKYDGFALPTKPIHAGATSVRFASLPNGWRVGDELLFPASEPGTDDETRTVTAIADSTVRFDEPLAHDHTVPASVDADVPVGNLTRNIVVASADTTELGRRAHTMFMAHEGTRLAGVRFQGLGRTTAERIHTLPEISAKGVDNGNNPIGRYAVHFHLRSGASWDNEPIRFEGNVIVDSPKHGLVNHGGYVVAENNVGFDVAGSHFFAENGSEIGVFRNNLAVRSAGSDDPIRSRESVYDFGHGGHGFWVQSPAVTIEDNYAFHHRAAAYSIFARPVMEFGEVVYFDRENLDPSIRDGAPGPLVSSGAVPFRFSRNVAGLADSGLELWNTNTYSWHGQPCIAEECRFWDTSRAGIDAPYTTELVVRNSTLVGTRDGYVAGIGVSINKKTEGLALRNVDVRGFSVGVDVPYRGETEVADCGFANHVDVRIHSAVQPGRRTRLLRNRFAEHVAGGLDYELAAIDYSYNGDFTVLFEPDELDLEDARYPGQSLYFAEQAANAVPFPEGEAQQVRGRTTHEIHAEYGLAIGGRVAPNGSRTVAGIAGLLGPDNHDYRGTANDPADAMLDQNVDHVYFRAGEKGEESGWRFETTETADGRSTQAYYVDATPPRFVLDPRLERRLHPDDLDDGIMLAGMLYDEVGGRETFKNVNMVYYDLEPDEDGVVRILFQYPDSVGNLFEQEYEFEVSEEATRRGPNLGYYMQAQFSYTDEARAGGIAAPSGDHGRELATSLLLLVVLSIGCVAWASWSRRNPVTAE